MGGSGLKPLNYEPQSTSALYNLITLGTVGAEHQSTHTFLHESMYKSQLCVCVRARLCVLVFM